ncbi:MOSC domain-containing protein [Brachybacterium sp. EF45031]|nr:MOSC domain-containing protein [Brachybacterium sillae]
MAQTTGIRSGIDKRPVCGRVEIGRLGLQGDYQGDTSHHGGLFKAVYCVSREMREDIARQEGRTLPDGAFGENLVTVGIDTDEVLVGQRWRVGGAVLEATCRRDPCQTFADWMGDPGWPRRFRSGGRSGAYFRVIEPGSVQAGDPIEVLTVPDHGVSIGQTFRGLQAHQARALLDWAVETTTVLYESQVRSCLTILDRQGQPTTFPAALRSTGR